MTSCTPREKLLQVIRWLIHLLPTVTYSHSFKLTKVVFDLWFFVVVNIYYKNHHHHYCIRENIRIRGSLLVHCLPPCIPVLELMYLGYLMLSMLHYEGPDSQKTELWPLLASNIANHLPPLSAPSQHLIHKAHSTNRNHMLALTYPQSFLLRQIEFTDPFPVFQSFLHGLFQNTDGS